jgi:hypothetical protein
MPERTIVRLTEELLNRARRAAAAEGRTLTSLIEDGLRVIVGENRRTERRKPGVPRVSKAGGGLMPGIDLIDPSTLQDADDLDYVRRMLRFE